MATDNEVEIRLVVEDVLSKKYKQIQNEIREANRKSDHSIKRLGATSEKSADKIKSSFLSAKTAVVALAAVATGGLVKAFVKAGSEVEDLSTQFKVLLGSAEAATFRMKELEKFAQTTPFQLTEIANASKILQTLTKGALASGDGLRLVGDVAAATGAEFSNLALHVGRAYDGLRNNRPVGESLARLQELEIVSGATRAEIEKLTAKGLGVQAWELLEKQLANSKGGMEELSKTASGLGSTIKDQLQAAMRKILASGLWDKFRDLLGKIVVQMNKLLEGDTLDRIGKGLIFITDHLGAVATAAAAFLAIWAGEKLKSALTGLKNFNVALSRTQIAFAAVTAAIAAIEFALDKMDQRTKQMEGIDLMDPAQVERTRKALEFIRDTGAEIDELEKKSSKAFIAGQIREVGLTKAQQEKIQAFKEEEKFVKSQFSNFDRQKSNINDMIKGLTGQKEVIKQIADESKKAAAAGAPVGDVPAAKERPGTKVDLKARLKQIKDAELAMDRARTTQIDKARELNDQLQNETLTEREKEMVKLVEFHREKSAILLKAGLDTVSLDEAIAKRRSDINKEFEEKQTKKLKEESEKRNAIIKQTASVILSGAASFTSALGNLARVRGENELKAAEANGASEAKLDAIRKKSFEKQKQFSLMSAKISLAQAVLAGYSQKPFIPVGLAAGTLALLSGKVQIDAINAQKYAQGGIVPGSSFSGDRVTAQVNSGEAIINRSQQRRLLDLADGKRPGSGGGVAQTINFEAPNIFIENGQPEVIKRAVEETFQEQISNFAAHQRESEIHGILM